MTSDRKEGLRRQIERELNEGEPTWLLKAKDWPALGPSTLMDAIEAIRYCRELAGDAIRIATDEKHGIQDSRLDSMIANILLELSTLAKGSASAALVPHEVSISPQFTNAHQRLLREAGVATVHWLTKKRGYTKKAATIKVITASQGELSESKLRTAREKFQQSNECYNYNEIVNAFLYSIQKSRFRGQPWLQFSTILDAQSEALMLKNVRAASDAVRAQRSLGA